MPLRLSELYVHPIKSCAGVSVPSARLTDRGLEHDRRWMIVDENGVFISQRDFPFLCLLEPSLHEEELAVRHARMPYHTLRLPLRPDREAGDPVEVVVWRSRVAARAVSTEADDWFSRIIGRPCRLVHMPDEARREVNPNVAQHGEIVSFADGYPYLIIGQASLNDLNLRLGGSLGMRRFRPNLVFTGGEPYAEDDWNGFRIGESIFFPAKRCGRCVITTIDPATGQKQDEPLRMLASYRKSGDEVVFGVNLLANGKGEIAVGDKIELL